MEGQGERPATIRRSGIPSAFSFYIPHRRSSSWTSPGWRVAAFE